MKNVIVIIFLILLNQLLLGQKTLKYNADMKSFTDKGILASKDRFTGTVWINMNVLPEDGYNSNVGTVTFEPRARTNWHSHKSGQVLFVIEGTGYYQIDGQPIRVMNEGDVVKIPKNARHWHGASHNSKMRHIAIVTDYDQDKTEWFQPVTNAEYDKFRAPVYEVENRLSVRAIKNYEELWPEYPSNEKEMDPDLAEIFLNFAYDEVINNNPMDVKIRTMVIMASTLGSQALSEFKMFVNAALNIGVTPVQIKEVIYQSVPYIGKAKVKDFLDATNGIFIERDIKLPLQSQTTTNPETRFEKGYAKQREVIGDRIEELYKNSPEDLIHIQKFLSDNCFGDYITRSGLDIKTRELITLSFLISLGGTESQIKGHIQGNKNVGNSRQDLVNLMTNLLPYVGYPRTLNAINCLNEILPYKKNDNTDIKAN
ncbi:cupin domain-containing carboxymuconolactone decarboxylase family protein [Chryseobacterium culicis]|uniref:4-carboxymuconolactone decarboxylase n=1 Tax=Chryseobacterium culicis TaxID=680127 RepID=A0A1H6IJ26_CHRCI|nr:carboxymuconolactone decarboxylase family protein [Chryseobacterium culicis]SEH47909.1 4-carboxymuconolactone decarboxylase [Chryseobacterium culicis]